MIIFATNRKTLLMNDILFILIGVSSLVYSGYLLGQHYKRPLRAKVDDLVREATEKNSESIVELCDMIVALTDDQEAQRNAILELEAKVSALERWMPATTD